MYLIDVLEQLDFIDEGILIPDGRRNDPLQVYNNMKESIMLQKADIQIVSPNQDQYITPDVQQNLFKILCAIQNLKPRMKGTFRLGQALVDQHTAQITFYNPNGVENLI